MEAVFSRPQSTPPDLSTEYRDPRSRRRHLAQRPRREAEQTARQLAVKYSDQSCQLGVSAAQVAEQLGVSSRTIRHWRSDGREKKNISCRGRPPTTCSAAERNEVIRFLREVSGPAVGLAALRALFQSIPRCMLEDLLRRYRRVWRRRYQQSGFRLTWRRAGTVWAIDFSEARHPIDGVYDYLFAVRDLASHRQLAWHPFHGETARETILVLADLFRRHGPPLVIKSDNGSAFIADIFRDLLQSWDVVQLFSPARHPQYNGALERSNATLKTFTHQHAINQGHPFRWTSEDVDQARQLANTLSRPWGHRGASPEEAWETRAPLTPEDRQSFLDAVARHQIQARSDLGVDEAADLNRQDQARVNRLAISRALLELGQLEMNRVVRPPAKAKRLSRDELTRGAVRHCAASFPPRLTSPPSALSTAPVTTPPSDPPRAATSEPTVTSPPTRNRPPRRATLPSVSVAPAPRATDSPEPFGKPPTSLAMLCAHDIMRRHEGIPDILGMLALMPETTHGERSHTSWLRRSITLLLTLVKTAIISRL